MSLLTRLGRRVPTGPTGRRMPMGPASVTEDDLLGIHQGEQYPEPHDGGLVPCDVLPIWHLPGRCPTAFLCPTPKEA